MLCLIYLPALIFALVSIGSTLNDSDTCAADESEPWSYRGMENGPDQWGTLFPQDCSGNSQSPIDIDSFSAEYKYIEPLGFNNYRVPIPSAIMVNNGHTVQLMPDDEVERTIVINREVYALTQFHFHWGLNRNEGSEHELDGGAFAMELHLVHATTDGRIAVVGVFLEEDRKNGELQTIVNSLPNVRYNNTRTNLESSLVLRNLLPKKKSFYRYNGSLTTPNCTQGVIWTVFSCPIQVAESQMNEFRKVLSVTKQEASEDGNADCLMAPNYRPVQPINGRPVYYSV